MIQKRLPLVVFASLIWVAVLFARGSDHATLFTKWTDNISNITSSWIFLHHGLGIYGYGISDFTDGPAQPSDFEKRWSLDLPDDVFFKDVRDSSQANYVAWPNASRPYPPGAFLIYAPISFLTYVLNWGYQWPAYLLAFIFLIFSHFGFLKFSQILDEVFPNPQSKSIAVCLNVLRFYFYLEMIMWALQGQYQVCMVWPLLESFLRLKNQNYIQGIFWFSVAFFIHLHSIMYAPLVGLICLALFIDPRLRRNRELKLTPGDVLLLASSIFMSGLALYCLIRNLTPYTSGQLSNSNPWFWKSWGLLTWQQLTPFFVGVIVILGTAWRAKSYLSVISFFSICCIFVMGSNLGAWYTLAVLPLLATAIWSKEPKWALAGNVIAHILVTGTFLANSPLEFYFLRAYLMAPLG